MFSSTTTTIPYVHPAVRSRVKRAIDVVGSLTGLTVLLVLLIPLAIAIRLDSPGPIFFSQRRAGWRGKPFRLWKLRSMIANAEKYQHLVNNQVRGPLFKNDNDPRITKVGRFLRRTSLDEFPQFWNVLCGEMSLVGTRPPTLQEVEQYSPHHWRRLEIRPGITGEWQVHGRSRIRDFEQVVELDLRYQERWSVAYDLQLLGKTILAIFTKNGAC